MAKIKKNVGALFNVRIRNREEHKVFGRLYFGAMSEARNEAITERIYSFFLSLLPGSENEIIKDVKIIEIAVLDPEKQKAIGLPPDLLPQYIYWIGLKITDEVLWAKLEKSNVHNVSIEMIEDMET